MPKNINYKIFFIFLYINKVNLNMKFINKNVIYTCIVGNYDSLKTPTDVSVGWDYVCFTDNTDLTSSIWDIRPLPPEVKDLDNSRKNRYVKINAHKLLPDYNFSIYIDGTMKPRFNLNLFKQNYCSDYKTPLYLLRHPRRDCIYKEFFACAQQNKDEINIMYEQSKKYHEEGYPYNNGLTHNCMLYRWHNEPACIEIMEKLWEQVSQYSLRDQLSMMYSIWATHNEDKVVILDRQPISLFFDLENSWYHDKIHRLIPKK